MNEQELSENKDKLAEAINSDKPIQIIYNITNQESWSAAFKQFFKGLFSLLTIATVLGLLTDAAGCVDLARIVHGP